MQTSKLMIVNMIVNKSIFVDRRFSRHVKDTSSRLGFVACIARSSGFYTITDQDRDAERILGFIGLYDMQGVKLAMALFRPRDRRRGYGCRALDLLLADTCRRDPVLLLRQHR
jgi:hypothetical protein